MNLLAQLLRGEGPWSPGTRADEFLSQAHLHGVSALLHEALETDPRGVPDEVRAVLRERALRAAAVELACRPELQRLLGRFSERGIAAIVLKGTALAYSLYRQPHLRPRVDVDLLVSLDRRDRACERLLHEGYVGDWSAAGRFVRTQAEFRPRTGNGRPVDLHWRISNSPVFNGALSYESLRGRAVPAPRLHATALTPCPVDALLHACAHRAARLPVHGAGPAHGERLIWLQDIKLLAAALDAAAWSDLLARATRHRLCAICLDAFRQAKAALGAAIPQEVLETLQREGRRYEPSAAFFTAHRWRIFLAELGSLGGSAERWHYLSERALPPAGYLRGKYRGARRWPLPALYVRHLVQGLRRRQFR